MSETYDVPDKTGDHPHPLLKEKTCRVRDQLQLKSSSGDIDQTLFQPNPSELVFQNFTHTQTHKLPVVFVNNDKVSRHVKMELKHSEYFHVVGPEDAVSKVAPGLCATFPVVFTPTENKDYFHKLVFVTDQDRFEVPVRAIGPRAILDFPDELRLPLCPVKASTEKTHFVRNVGNSKANFTLHTQRPFSVTPAFGTLDIGVGMQVTVSFNPMTTGDQSQDLLLHYHTGEDVHVRLHGACEELNVHLEPDSVTLEKTYISLSSVHKLSLTNSTDIPLRYRWSAWPGQEEEDLSLLRESSVLQQKEEEERERLLFQCESDPTAIHRLPLLTRALQECRSRAARDRLVALSDSCITVEPAEGEIWPRTTALFYIVFKPEEAKLHQQTMYCDVTGRNSRLPLTITGEGLGPKLQLDYDLTYMQNVFIGDKECCEVLASNKGLIDAPFRLSRPDTALGRCFSFSPEEGVVPTGACQIVEVTFHSRILGTFSEDLLLTVTGQPEPLTLTFSGCVIGPTFHFSVPELSFGDVAFGFPETLACTLFNTSLVPMTFALRVLGDGLGPPSVTSDRQVSEVTRSNWHGSAARDIRARPAEFYVSPAAGSLRCMSDVVIKVTLCSNTVKSYSLGLVVDVEGVGEKIAILPISARCVVPRIVVETPVLDFQRCFLNYPYEQEVQLTNPSPLPVCYGVLDQECEEAPLLLFGSSVPRGVILPHTSEKIPVFLRAKAVGELHHILPLATFGSVQPPLEVILTCVGQGPVVHVQNPQLDFGKIPVLTDITRTLRLSNHSPIPANFATRTSHRKSFWRVEPSEGEVPPESQLELRVVAHLRDTIDFRDKLEVSVRDSRTHTVQLSATGTGTTIVSDRPFAPKLDLGTHLSHETYQYRFQLSNHGQQIHRLYWATDGFPACTKTRKRDNSPGVTFLPPINAHRKKEVQSRGSVLSSSREKPVFSLTPSRLELWPGCSVDMVLTGSSDSPKVVRERLVCRGFVGNQDSYKLIMSVDVACRFVAPVLSISAKQLNYYIENVPGESLTPLYQKLVLKNVSALSLSMTLALVEPFSLCEARGAQSSATTKSMVLGDGAQTDLWVCYHPEYCQDWVSRVVDEYLEVQYQGHPQQDRVALHAEVHFPNLHFSTTSVDFGCVRNYTETHRTVTITNCSPLPVSYRWAFVEEQGHSDVRESEMHEKKEEQKYPQNETEDGRRSSTSPSHPASPVRCSHRPGACDPGRTPGHVRVNEVFDVLPMYGHLLPGDQQLVTVSFYGHEHISREMVALCHVKEGPTYEVTLRGEASVISYSLNFNHIDFGRQLFDHIGKAEVTLRNTGKVGFKFTITYPQREEEEEEKEKEAEGLKEAPEELQRITPGQPTAIPSLGYVDAGAEQCLRVLYLPGCPEVFEKQLQLQVAYLPPEDITVTGQGVFPRISLNLPRNLSEECYRDVVQGARAAVDANAARDSANGGGATTREGGCKLTNEELLHMEIERVLVKENALAANASSLELRDSEISFRKCYKLSKLLLPEYVLDFGYVIHSKVPSHTVNVTNTGSVPVSLHANVKPLAGKGFSAEFERVKNLPCGETQTFTVKFDPQGAKLPTGDIRAVMTIQVADGPTVQVRLCAVVTVPAITVPMETLQFDTVQCGMCQMKTIPLLNRESVPCHWSITEEVKPFKIDKFMPLHQRKKVLQEQRPAPVVFQTIPSSGVLAPGKRVHVQIKFSPAEGHAYNRRLVVHVAENAQPVFITAQGQGEEPQLKFCPSVLELGPCLPVSTGVEAAVAVVNPCPFPVEFYSLEFDTQYLNEEKILRLVQGYDDNNVLLLPPRFPGGSLPRELLDYYKEHCSQQKDEVIQRPTEVNGEMLGQLEMTPVSRAIARHMCVDLSPEGQAAHNRRGIAVIVYGAPLMGKSSTAAALAHHYGGACLSVDAVVTYVLVNGTSPVSLTARQHYDSAAAEFAKRRAAQTIESTTEPGAEAHNGGSEPAPQDSTQVMPNASEEGCIDTNSQEAEQPLALCLGGDVTTLCGLLPNNLLVDILAERFQLTDCHRGVVIDGLTSVYTQSAATTLQIVLRALKKRKHIYVVNLSDSFDAMMARERAQREAEEALQEEEVEREERWLQELDEDGYDALTEEKKELVTQRHRGKIQEYKLRKLEQEEEEKRQHEEVKRLQEQELKKKSKKGGKKDTKEMTRRKSMQEGKHSTESMMRQKMSTCSNSKESLADTRKQNHLNEGLQSKDAEELQKQTEETKPPHVESPKSTDNSTEPSEMKRLKDEKELKKTSTASSQVKESDQSVKKTEEAKGLQESPPPADKPEGEMPVVSELQAQFIAYEQGKVQVAHILQHWDRTQGSLRVQLPPEDAPLVSEDVGSKKQSPAGKKGKKGTSKALSPMPSHADADKEGDRRRERASQQDVIPHIVLNVTERDDQETKELLKGSALPPLEQVLDDLGLGPSGPPIPPPVTLSVVPFPKKREPSNSQLACDCFTFLVPSEHDKPCEEQKDSEEDMFVSVMKEDGTLSRTRRKNSREIAVTKDKKGREFQRSKRRSSARAKTTHSPSRVSATSDSTEAELHENLELKHNQSLTKFRWVVPANGEVLVKIWFYSDVLGKFEQTLNFELLGTQRRYQLFCRGICAYPSISKDHRILFPRSKKVQKVEDRLQKTYVVKPGYFEFGPLLCSKTRDRYKENRYPENRETLVIHNNSGLEAEVQFTFQHDKQATTFILDPPTMTLKPDQKQELTVWAYPTRVEHVEDSVVCSIRDNPELVLVNLSCWGVRPELELETRHLHFDRVLLHRRDSRTVTLHNKTVLPVSWRLQGLEELGDEFSVPQDQGIISPNSSFILSLHFRARKPLHIKKKLRLEVSDVEDILGIVHTDYIQVSAEAYDIALDISPDGCLDFGTIKVFEEARLSLRMKNQGKYEIAYKFTFEQTQPNQPNLDSMFVLSPQSGILRPHEKPTTVKIVCTPKTAVSIGEQPIMPCQVIEPNIGNGGETIAILTIKVSVHAVFSRYKITPVCDINFGPLVFGSKRSQSFTIENNGFFEFRYSICNMVAETALIGRPGGKKIPQESVSGKASGASHKGRRESVQRDNHAVPNRLSLGIFSVAPCLGTLQPGTQQVVTVECAAEQLGCCNQGLLIDISDRDPSDHPEGVPYKLLAEVCRPAIALDMPSIFEEHHLCPSSEQLSSEQFRNAEGIYVLDDNQFVFHKVLVGRTAHARFKLTNSSKVHCVLCLAIRYGNAKMVRNMEVFHLSATTLNIPSQSHAFAVVTFTPQSMQQYGAVFEAAIEGANRMTPTSKTKVLEFELMGEGNLPSVCVLRPAPRNGSGSPVFRFRRVLVGRRHTLPLVLLNDGNVPAQVQIDILDKHGVFTLTAAPGNTCSSISCSQLEASDDSENRSVHRTTLELNVNEQVEFEVSFYSDGPVSAEAEMMLQVEDNQHSDTVIPLTGETYWEIVSLDNVRRPSQKMDREDDERGRGQANNGSSYCEVLDFGDCHVDCPYQESFTMTNHSSSTAVRFEWPPAGPQVVFSPQVGHLHAGCSKEVTVTFSSNQPVTLNNQPMRCEVHKVKFEQPVEQVMDWDDRQRTVQWLTPATQQESGTQPQQPVKNKVTETEPRCSVVEGSHWGLELRVSTVCDYVKFTCSANSIHFKDTMLYRTRLHQLQIVNGGRVRLGYSWQVLMDPSSNSDQGGESSVSRPGSRSVGGASTAARPSSAVSSVMSVLTRSRELPPFSVEPEFGTIEPGSTQDFSVRFSPLEAAQLQGRLLCSIPNLQYGNQAPCISVCGLSLQPHCHFDLEDSDYVSGSRRNPEFREPLDPDVRIIEFNAIGLSAPSTRTFAVVNPTSAPYSFKWKCEDADGSPFHCLSPCGDIPPGRKVEMCFEYVAKQLDAVESFWSFAIETLSLSFPFLCAGNTREPVVYLSRPHLELGELLVGLKAEHAVYLINGEEDPLYFTVLQSSLVCDDQESSLVLEPASGSVSPKDRLRLALSFTPCREGYVSFRLVLKVKRKSEPLALTVKADCFSLSTLVQVEDPDGGVRDIDPDRQDTVDFGKLGVSEQGTVNILVSNLARFSLEVNFDLTGPSELLQHLEAKPQHATVEVGEQLQSLLVFCPQVKCNLHDVRLSVKVKHGPTFTFAVKGTAVAPSVELSFTKFNFGKCFLFSPGLVSPSQTLVISNKGEVETSVQCQFKSTSYLETRFQPDVLSPGDAMDVPVTFRPREACRYHEKLTFVFNGCVTKHVDILGQGIELKLDVEDPKQRKLKLGHVTLGQKVKKQVVLVNRSLSGVSFTLLLSTDTPLDMMDLSFTPAGELNLTASGGSCHVEIQFSPRQHIPPFNAELLAECSGLLHPLLTVQGCCQVVEVQLDLNQLAFGAVVQHCQARKRIVMTNTGDMGARFHWKTKSFPPELSISPGKGFIPPGMEVPFDVTFAPKQLSNDKRYDDLTCIVENFSSPVTFTATGSCTAASTSKEVLNFVCPVRGSHSQTLKLANPTNQRCSIRPVLEGEQWRAAPSVTLEALQQKTYEITYRPLTMAANGKKHLGSVFFSFPDGTATLYYLQGTADPPKVEDTLVRELPAKTEHTELLPVKNWLSKQQRFRVLIEILKPGKPDATVSLKGQEYIDVPALAKRNYKMSYFTYREGQHNTKVTFRNEATDEYLFYIVTFKATPPGVLATIELVTTVRRTTSATVQVENPLTTATCLTTECKSTSSATAQAENESKCADINAPPQHTVPPQSKDSLSFQYQPLRAGVSTARLTLCSADLGYFHYDLILRALPPPPEKTVSFNTSLGSSHSVLVKFTNYCRFKTDYACKIDCPDFAVGKLIVAPPGPLTGCEANFEVCFEPHQVGEVRGQLSLSSGLGGEYVFPLHGICLPAKAQGPFTVTAGRIAAIPFKNVFLQTVAFSFQVDNPCFTVKGVDSLPSKKTHNTLVSFVAPAGGQPGPWLGKLTISSQRAEGHSNPCSWVFYLKGVRPDSA
ncbi:hydrocephalus-inducing protein homolog isoform X1 [Scophthalmus maximus]|uniref:hydrocephalus-inducing protein homolog isoform X1 n=1 Tax=Scophthalmus maximus TaxID=52904 RepID=UPI001FA825E4|nr:hydrocephalus-inducing protein homolog isoform X1 [Scophthalmus maximus]